MITTALLGHIADAKYGWRQLMHVRWRVSRHLEPHPVAVVVFALILALGCSQSAAAQQKPLQGGAQRNENQTSDPSVPQLKGGVTQDEFNSNGDDKRPYISPDGRWFDRCSYERDHPSVWDQMYGKPDIVPITQISTREARALYIRCAVNSCDPTRTAVCWRNPTPQDPNTDSAGYPNRDRQPVVPPYGSPAPGGYDPCANPNAWRIPQCQNASSAKSAPSQRDCDNVPDQATQQALLRTGNELVDTLAGMGSQADNMLTHFSQATIAQINLLLHPQQIAAGALKTVDAAVAFLANQDPAKWATLRDQAMEAFRRDPSGALGDLGAGMFVGELTGGVCSVGAAGSKALAERVATTQRATGSLRKIVGNMKQMEDSSGNIACASSIAKAGNPDLTNPFWHRNNCVPATIAGALRDLDGKPWTDLDVVTRYPRGAEVMNQLNAGKALRGALMYDMIRYFLGAVVPKGLSVDRLLDQIFGVPSPITRRAIETELLEAGSGSGGMVFVRFIEDGVEKQHVFKASNEGDVIKYVDNQRGTDGSHNFDEAVGISFFRYR